MFFWSQRCQFHLLVGKWAWRDAYYRNFLFYACLRSSKPILNVIRSERMSEYRCSILQGLWGVLPSAPRFALDTGCVGVSLQRNRVRSDEPCAARFREHAIKCVWGTLWVLTVTLLCVCHGGLCSERRCTVGRSGRFVGVWSGCLLNSVRGSWVRRAHERIVLLFDSDAPWFSVTDSEATPDVGLGGVGWEHQVTGE